MVPIYRIQRELSNEYQHDRVKMIFIKFCSLVHCTKVTSASEELTLPMLMLLSYEAQERKDLNPVMLVFIGKLSLSTLI